jgi:hypothetical protein
MDNIKPVKMIFTCSDCPATDEVSVEFEDRDAWYKSSMHRFCDGMFCPPCYERAEAQWRKDNPDSVLMA